MFLEEVKRAGRLLADFHERRARASDEELWKAQKLRSAIFHPGNRLEIEKTTGEC